MVAPDPSDPVAGKRVVVTGATSGIGLATATELARRGAALTIVCRNPTKGETTAAEIEARTGTRADLVIGDLSEIDQVRGVAAELADRYDHLDVLVNNAGCHDTTPTRTRDGFDHMLATNYLGPFLLTNLALDLVRAAPAGRVVTVASEAHRNAGRFDAERFEDLGDYGRLGSFRAYGRTKLLDLIMALELARRLRDEDSAVTSNALCPGMVATNLFGAHSPVGRLASLAARSPVVYTPEQGARWSIRLAADPEWAGTSGRFFTTTPGMGRVPAMRPVLDTAAHRRTWERTEELVGLV